MLRYLVVFAVLCTLAAVEQGKAAVLAKDDGNAFSLDNGILRVHYDGKTGTFNALRGEHRLFITEGRLVEADKQKGATARLIDVKNTLGDGKAVEVTWPDGRIRRLALYDGVPFVCASGAMRNDTDKDFLLA